MALKNIFNSNYAVVDNISYSNQERGLLFDLVMYSDSEKQNEKTRVGYTLDGNLEILEIGGVITVVPEECKYEAMPVDFDFTLIDSFKPYIIAAGATDKELAGKEGFYFLCDAPPHQDDDGEWPFRWLEEHEQISNPDYDASIPEKIPFEGGLSEHDVDEVPNPLWQPKMIKGDQKRTFLKIKYDWGALNRDTNKAFIDPDGNYWRILPNLKVSQIDKPFLSTDWDTWFSIAAMGEKDKNLTERIYSWIKTQVGFEAVTNV